MFRAIAGILLIFGLAKLAHHATDGFTILRIQADLPLAKAEEKDLSMLDQKFFYKTKGAQSYVFVSQDEKYVLKFFKFHHLRLSPMFVHLPLTMIQDKKEIKAQELSRAFDSFRIAYENLPEETGLVYLHLNKTSELKKRITIVDKLNIAHQIPADDFAFVLQRRADPIASTLQRYMETKGLEAAKSALDSLCVLIQTRKHKGIADLDANFSKNFGFVEGQAIQIDCGRFTRTEEAYPIKAGGLQSWLNENYPELGSYFEQKVNAL
jgi:hypothetical protein